ncbi:MAG TPA: LptF/LptG family permease [Paludibacteraceae bacterium]|nr:LptF/LptG family permease [Paludibacteraceae bacterium]
MLGIKKLDIYVIKSFLAYFFMTFFICILILMMQFTWKHLAELVGKGVEWKVLAEFFWYTTLQTVPMALPLAILLAALMNFGNLGENFELIAMKSAGISLFRIMRGLIVFIAFICVAAFFFSNNVLPIAQNKLWTLIFSLRQKSPEFEIPEGEFYSEINGINLYVRHKVPEKKLLKDLMIYDFSNGFDNATVTLADSGRVQFTADNKYLKMTLLSGESFENLKQPGNSSATNIPYRRETFSTKEMLIDFDTEFNRFDESILKDQHISKNIVQLTNTIDSVSKIVKARGNEQAVDMIKIQFAKFQVNDSVGIKKQNAKINPDSLFMSLAQEKMEEAMRVSQENLRAAREKIDFNKVMLEEPTYYVRRHQVEWHRKFTLSFACLIFFFIGAPLGAIIRKGGLGLPVVISVLMFIFYYIIETSGYKMAREGFWEVYQGMWLSSAVLLPIGLFLTYKAVTDASLFRSEQYVKILEKTVDFLTNFWRKKKNRINTGMTEISAQ